MMRHEQAVAPVSVPVADITSTQRLPTTYAEAMASVRPVVHPFSCSCIATSPWATCACSFSLVDAISSAVIST
ncbi:hypothetical protein CCR75_009435 [Bremia lactucae]|uniref:Uncharacterized protein n=1 Tax=Bremia lactucae TaxID=4779 RepID=A0A976NYT6_BRELC|nr:hypothetical protein CCR75_009435 [Bremia lactucae]